MRRCVLQGNIKESTNTHFEFAARDSSISASVFYGSSLEEFSASPVIGKSRQGLVAVAGPVANKKWGGGALSIPAAKSLRWAQNPQFPHRVLAARRSA